MSSFDPIEKPRHYNSHPSGMEVIELTERMDFCLGNAVKYLLRCELKGNAVEDLGKIQWYLKRALNNREGTSTVRHLSMCHEGDLCGNEILLKFLTAEPSEFVRKTLGLIWLAHSMMYETDHLKAALEAVAAEMTRRKESAANG